MTVSGVTEYLACNDKLFALLKICDVVSLACYLIICVIRIICVHVLLLSSSGSKVLTFVKNDKYNAFAKIFIEKINNLHT